MKIRKNLKQLAAIILSMALLVTASGCDKMTGNSAKTDSQDFDAFMEALFLEEVTDNTLNLHYTLKNPEEYGIEDMEPTWGDLDDRDFEALEADFTDVQETLEQLQSYDYDALSEEQKLTYDIISNYVELELSLENCSYSGTIFGEITGVQSNIPLNMSLYEFYAEDDVEDYLALMEQVDDYFDYCLDYELYRTEKGCGMSDTIIDNAIDQCNMFIEHTDDNYLITTFDHRIDEIDISDREKEEYKSHNREIVINTVIPAYEDMITSLNDLKGKSKDLGGICNYKGGKQYYEYIIAHKTGSAKSIEELEDILKDVWEESINRVYEVYARAPEVCEAYYAGTEFPVKGLSEPEEFLEYYKSQMEGSFPTPPEVNYEISDIDPAIADMVSPAFCVTPCIDDYEDNVIQVNRSIDNGAGGGLSATYAHEGYPGHLYQMTYFLSTDPYPIRSCLDYLGYDEGWAMYVELRSYDQIEYEDYDSEDVRQMYVYGELENLAFCSLMDIYVNYYGYSVDELADYMNSIGYDGSVAQGLYDLFVEEPGYYPQYFIGYLEFEELRDYAEEKLGDSFDEAAYHKVILETGPCDFEILRTQMDKYIDSVLGSQS